MRYRLGAALALALPLSIGAGASVADLEIGATPPDFTLESLEGEQVHLSEQRGKPVILVFGEIAHENTQHALHVLEDVISRQGVADRVEVLLIVSERTAPEALAVERINPSLPLTALVDPERTTFVAYGVISAIPCVFFLTEEGTLQHTVSGYGLSFVDIASAQIANLTGQISDEELSRRLEATGPIETEGSRLARQVRLADNLRRRGFEEQARDRYDAVLREAPANVDAHLGLAALDLEESELASAEFHTASVLAQQPHQPRGLKLLARIQIRRGDLDEAEQTLQELVHRAGEDVQTVYLQGRLAEQRGDDSDALRRYRQVCEMLLPGEEW